MGIEIVGRGRACSVHVEGKDWLAFGGRAPVFLLSGSHGSFSFAKSTVFCQQEYSPVSQSVVLTLLHSKYSTPPASPIHCIACAASLDSLPVKFSSRVCSTAAYLFAFTPIESVGNFLYLFAI